MKERCFDLAGGDWKSPVRGLFEPSLIWSSNFHDMIWQGGRVSLQQWYSPCSLRASPLAPRGSWRKRALFRSTWIYVGEPETAGDGNCWPSRLAVARGFWQGSKWTQWVTLSFPVSLPFYSLFYRVYIPACLHLLPLPSCQSHFLQ